MAPPDVRELLRAGAAAYTYVEGCDLPTSLVRDRNFSPTPVAQLL